MEAEGRATVKGWIATAEREIDREGEREGESAANSSQYGRSRRHGIHQPNADTITPTVPYLPFGYKIVGKKKISLGHLCVCITLDAPFKHVCVHPTCS